MSNTRHLNWYGSPLIRAIGTTLVFLSLVSIPVASHAQNLGKQPATGQAVQGEQASQPEGAFLNLVDWIGNVICPVGAALAIVGCVISLASGPGLHAMGFDGWRAARGFRLNATCRIFYCERPADRLTHTVLSRE